MNENHRTYLFASLFFVGPACLAHLADRSGIDAAAFGIICYLMVFAVISLHDHLTNRHSRPPGMGRMLLVIGSFVVGITLPWLFALGVLS